MKTNFLRIPVSSWREDVSTPAAALLTESNARADSLSASVRADSPAVKPFSKLEDYYLVPDGKRLRAARRFVVIVPPGDFDDRELAIRVSRLGRPGRRDVLLVGLASDPQWDSRLRQRLATMCLMMRTVNAESNYRLIYGDQWLEALPEILVEGDRLVCLEEHDGSGGLFRNERLAQQLVSGLEIPVYVAQGIRLNPAPEIRWTRLKDLLMWVSVLLTLVLFFLAQVRIQQTIPGDMGTIAEMISVLIEAVIVVRIVSLGD